MPSSLRLRFIATLPALMVCALAGAPLAAAAVYDHCTGGVTGWSWDWAPAYGQPGNLRGKDYSEAYEGEFGSPTSFVDAFVKYRCLGVSIAPGNGLLAWVELVTQNPDPSMLSNYANEGGCSHIRVTNLATGAYDYRTPSQMFENFVDTSGGFVKAFCSVLYESPSPAVYAGANIEVQAGLYEKWDWESPESVGGVPKLVTDPGAHSEPFYSNLPGPGPGIPVVSSSHSHGVCYEPVPTAC